MSPTGGKGNIIPTMRYRDAPAAIDWLCNAFGVSKQLIVPREDGTIVHARLTLGSGMIMPGTDRDDEFGRMTKTPKEIGTTTQSAYIVIDEIDAHYQISKSAGTEIVMEIANQDHGGRLYSAKDPEGHLWNFGSYDPWAEA